nr:uncharacterized protein LOC129032744 [Pongo pygmaeus]
MGPPLPFHRFCLVTLSGPQFSISRGERSIQVPHPPARPGLLLLTRCHILLPGPASFSSADATSSCPASFSSPDATSSCPARPPSPHQMPHPPARPGLLLLTRCHILLPGLLLLTRCHILLPGLRPSPYQMPHPPARPGLLLLKQVPHPPARPGLLLLKQVPHPPAQPPSPHQIPHPPVRPGLLLLTRCHILLPGPASFSLSRCHSPIAFAFLPPAQHLLLGGLNPRHSRKRGCPCTDVEAGPPSWDSDPVWNPEVQNQGMGRTTLPPEVLGWSRPGLAPGFQGWLAILHIPGLAAVSLQPLPPSCCVAIFSPVRVSLFPLLIRTPVTGLGFASIRHDLSLT